MTDTRNTSEALTATLDLLAQALDTAFETDLLSVQEYDAVGALVWGALAHLAGQEPPAPLPTPEALGEALDGLSEAV